MRPLLPLLRSAARGTLSLPASCFGTSCHVAWVIGSGWSAYRSGPLKIAAGAQLLFLAMYLSGMHLSVGGMLCIVPPSQPCNARLTYGIAFPAMRRSPGAPRCPCCCRRRWSARRRCAAARGRRTCASTPRWRRWPQLARLHMPQWPMHLATGAACLAWLATGLQLQHALHLFFIVLPCAFPCRSSGHHTSAWTEAFMRGRAFLQGGDACGAAG